MLPLPLPLHTRKRAQLATPSPLPSPCLEYALRKMHALSVFVCVPPLHFRLALPHFHTRADCCAHFFPFMAKNLSLSFPLTCPFWPLLRLPFNSTYRGWWRLRSADHSYHAQRHLGLFANPPSSLCRPISSAAFHAGSSSLMRSSFASTL